MDVVLTDNEDHRDWPRGYQWTYHSTIPAEGAMSNLPKGVDDDDIAAWAFNVLLGYKNNSV